MTWLDYVVMATGAMLSLYAVARVYLAYRAKRFRHIIALSAPLYGGEGCGGISVVSIGAIDMAQLENITAPDNIGYEVIMVMDGDSYGLYMRRLVRRYALFEVALPRYHELPVEGIRHVWRNRFDAMRRITLIDKSATTPYEDLDAGIAHSTMEYILPLPRHYYLDRGAADVLLSLVAEFEHRAERIICGIDERISIYRRDSIVRRGGIADITSARSREVRRSYVPVDVVSRIRPSRHNICRIGMLTIICVGLLITVALFGLSAQSFATFALAIVCVVAARIYTSLCRLATLQRTPSDTSSKIITTTEK